MANGLDYDKAFYRAALEPGVFVVVAVDPVATLSPLNDPHATHQAREMASDMRKYLAFVRTIDLPMSPVASTKARRASTIPPLAAASQSQPKLHINLVHTSPPRRVPGEGVDETMCVPVWPTRPKDGCGRPPLKPTNYLGRKDAYVHTVMDAHVRVSHCDERGFRPALAPVLPPREMLRFDRYQQEDHAREAESYRQETQMKQQKHDHPDPPMHESPSIDLVSVEDLDDGDIQSEDFRLSTLMSGITFDAHTALSSSSASSIESHSEPPAPRISHSMRGAPTQRPASIASTNSTFSFRTISSEASDSPSIPTFRYPSSGSDLECGARHARRRKFISPPSPTAATDLSGATRVAHPHANSSSTLAKPWSQHYQVSQAIFTRHTPSTNWGNPSFGESDEEEEEMPSRSFQCQPHVKVWFDLSMVDETADPREFFEELKALRAIERMSDNRYLQEHRRATAERVAAWNQLTVQLPARIPTSPIKCWRSKQKQKSLPPSPTTAAFPPIPAPPRDYAPKDTPLHHQHNCWGHAPPSAWLSSNNFHSGTSFSQSTAEMERRKSGGSLKPLKTLWRKMKSHSNLKAV